MKSGPTSCGSAWICAGTIAVLLAAGAAQAATPTVAVEDIPPTPEDALSARPGADGLIRNGDESTVERVFVYVDGCPMMELVRPDPGTGVPHMVMLPGDAGPCAPTRGAGTGVAPGTLDGVAGLAEDTGLHVRLFREDASTAPRTDVERLTAPDGQSLIIDISSVDPMAIEVMARGGVAGPVGPGGRNGFTIPSLPGEEIVAGTGSPAAGRPGGGRGYGGGGYGGGGRGGGSDVIQVSALEPGGSGPSGGPRPVNGGNAGPVPPIPLPASVVLLLGAVLVLAGAVRRLHHRPRRALAALRGGRRVSV